MVGRDGARVLPGSPGTCHRARVRTVAQLLNPRPMTELRQAWNLPSRPRPVFIIGAGGIVRTAHLPAYQRLRLAVAGVFHIKPEAAHETARRFAVPKVFATLAESARLDD